MFSINSNNDNNIKKIDDETTPLVVIQSTDPDSEFDGPSSTTSDDNGGNNNNNNNNRIPHPPLLKKILYAIACSILIAVGAFMVVVRRSELTLIQGPKEATLQLVPPPEPATSSTPLLPLPLPAGVNFGSWLSLEDYFFASHAAVEVATPNDRSQAQCLPPLVPSLAWQSETDLLAALEEESLVAALRAIHAYRISYVDFHHDLALLQQLGITHVRVPLSWCLTDANPDDDDGITRDNARSQYTCDDPFLPGVLWPAVPKAMVLALLRASAAYGILVTLDVHTYPGGTSLGTFSGVWPRAPQFWHHDDPHASTASESASASTSTSRTDVGRRLWMEFVEWMESLIDTDPQALAGLHAVSPMNEPAHLAGLFENDNNDDPKAFLPPLPPDLAQQFLSELAPPSSASASSSSLTRVPNGPHLRVMLWLRDAVATFRASRLVEHGKHIHVNIHESVLQHSVLLAATAAAKTVHNQHPNNNTSTAEEDLDVETVSLQIIAAWWRGITQPDERATWAVLDVHHYHAWAPSCQGSVAVGEGNYTCGDFHAMNQTLARCASWATTWRRIVTEECGGGNDDDDIDDHDDYNNDNHDDDKPPPPQQQVIRLVSAEFSVATHHQVRHACQDVTTLRAWYVAQLDDARQADIDLYYWSYRMPYGGAFRAAWSLRQLLYLLQQQQQSQLGEELPLLLSPDEPTFECGVTSLLGNVPTDDTYSP